MSIEIRKYDDYADDMNRIAYWLIKNNKIFNKRKKYGYMNRTADLGTIEKVVLERGNNFEPDGLVAEYVECAIVDNKDHSFLPNYVDGADGTRFYKSTYVDMANRVSLWEVEHNGASPKFVWVQNPYKPLKKVTEKISKATRTTINNHHDLYKAFTRTKYKYYYNDLYTQEQALNRIQNGYPLNCTDLNQIAYAALKELGYEVRIVRGTIQCNRKYGHVWCQIKQGHHWVNFDASAAAKNKEQGRLICGTKYEITHINPSWAVSDDGRT